jgi:hypothetical protein
LIDPGGTVDTLIPKQPCPLKSMATGPPHAESPYRIVDGDPQVPPDGDPHLHEHV